ncbi:MAG: hypothetical protein F4Z15_08230 [Gammaproteobacteria bacterium]|nr:hypothetical protein [Gammaproteobacteria bacterium]MYD76522.1 hypothetical protein [Gammaproteobacteria bacterium]MYJ52295.1 hypothetical protein [Gammaproteobacteria bacterium]
MSACIRKLTAWAGGFLLAVLLTGCLESPEVTVFEPGVYKGADDPLLANRDSGPLNERFSGQMDR